MSADIFYTIGATHQVCQDFAITDGKAYVIISDGCSSAKDSDWGARFLAKALDNNLYAHGVKGVAISEIISLAQYYVEVLHLEQDCLAATLLWAHRTSIGVNVYVSGDGCVIARKLDGSIEVIEHYYDTGAPYYPYYACSEQLKKGYATNFGHGGLNIEKSVITDKRKQITDAYGRPFDSINMLYSFPKEEYDLVGITTDGLKSFVRKVKLPTTLTNKSVAVEEITGDLFDFKSFEGQFVHRRCQKAFRGFHSQEIKNNDDFAIGVIHL